MSFIDILTQSIQNQGNVGGNNPITQPQATQQTQPQPQPQQNTDISSLVSAIQNQVNASGYNPSVSVNENFVEKFNRHKNESDQNLMQGLGKFFGGMIGG